MTRAVSSLLPDGWCSLRDGRRRYAAGEIDEDEFSRRRSGLAD